VENGAQGSHCCIDAIRLQALKSVLIPDMDVQFARTGDYDLAAIVDQSLNSYRESRMIIGG
jgi:hypothetical protein